MAEVRWTPQAADDLEAIAFGLKDHLDDLCRHRLCRVAYQPVINTFNDRTSVELQVVDMAFPEA